VTGIIESLTTATSNWKDIWDDTRRRIPQNEWAKDGFHGHADRYWAIVKGLICAFDTRRASLPLPIKADCKEVGAHLKFILSYSVPNTPG
jgi:hypothetical protein